MHTNQHQLNQSKGNQCESQKLQNLWQKIQDLSEVQQQSRNEQIPLFFQENSISISKKEDSFYQTGQILCNQPSIIQHVNVYDESTQNQQIQSNKQINESDSTNFNKKSINSLKFSLMDREQLYELNMKLIQDNKKLFNECIRLRKQFLGLENKLVFQKECQIAKSSNNLISQELKNKVESLEKQNKKLKKKILKQEKQHNQQSENLTRTFKSEYQLIHSQFQHTVKQNKHLKLKILELQKQNEKVNRTNSLSTITFESKSQSLSGDKQRVINNMKIVHESELKKLKQIIRQKELMIKNLSKNQESL